MSTTACLVSEPDTIGATIALVRALSFANVRFVRFFALDIGGQVRCKAIPLAHLQKHPEKLAQGVCLVEVCMGGLPSFGDVMQAASGMTAEGTLHLRPDLATLRILPYAPQSALVFGSLHNSMDHKKNNKPAVSDLCCRSLLQRIVDQARQEQNLKFTVGVELEFVLLDSKTLEPVEHSNFADTTLLNQQQDFVTKLYEQLEQQEISIELLHAESAAGQMEVVLEFLADPVTLVDHTMITRQTIQAVAYQHGMKAVFLPKVTATQAGNGCHLHISFVDAASGTNKFACGPTNDNDISRATADSDMSPMGRSFLEGVLQQLPSLLALTMPSTNSFRRVGPGCWTGHEAVWAIDDKEAPLRVVPNCSRVEYKLCDGTANLYLALASILTAGLDGMAQSLQLRPSWQDMKKDDIETLPSTITDSLNLLEENRLWQAKFPPTLVKGYLAIRRAEAEHSVNLSLADEVKEAIKKA